MRLDFIFNRMNQWFPNLVLRHQSALGISQECREILETTLLLTNESQITQMVSIFCCILLETACTILEAAV
jgi:hypothetical protein